MKFGIRNKIIGSNIVDTAKKVVEEKILFSNGENAHFCGIATIRIINIHPTTSRVIKYN
jgi:hypothetical protein